ncbi:MAG: penicillin acylase family protein, partial [Gemmatimonadaceae bacterium]|nr:penicillin acylase family protein [Acetobacteraceae bacterium]
AAGDASAMISAPVQNMLVADRLTIGQFTTGRIPLRRAGNGAMPVDGADGLHDWTGFAEGEALPRVVSPPSGRLVNANERIAPPDFPVFMGQDWFGDWRARRIRDRLAAGPHTVATFAELQVDPVSAFAVQVLPSLLAVQPLDEASTRALGLLRDWDGAMRADLPQPLLFNAWMQRFEATVLGRASLPSAGTRADFVANALSQDGAAWCDGDCEPLLSQSLRDTVASLTATRGPSPRDWQWGAVHQAVFAHPLLGRLPVIGPLTTARVAQDGDDTTVNRGGMRGDSWTSVHGAGFRGVYDLQDLDRSVFALTPGQSGHPLRGGATSLIERWLQGTTLLLGPRGDAVDDTVELTP